MTITPDSASKRTVQKIRKKALLFLVLSCAVGVGALFLVNWYMGRIERETVAPAPKTTAVVVAATQLPLGATLDETVLAVVPWPPDSVPEGSFGMLSEVVGRTLVQAAVKGEPILQERLADQNAGRGLAALLEKGTRAMTVRVDQVVGVGGFLQPGDRVDVIATMAPDKETRLALESGAAKISKVILQNIKVMAAGEQLTSQGTKPIKVPVVTLEVFPDQSERLALASRYGEIQLTLRSRLDGAPVPTAGITPLTLLSPDDGAEPLAKPEEEPKAPPVAPVQAAAVPAWKRWGKPPEPARPIVEILRGSKIEERKLRPTADSGAAPTRPWPSP